MSYDLELRKSYTLEGAIYEKFYALGRVMHWKDLYPGRGFALRNQLFMERDKNKRELHITYGKELHKQTAKK